MDEHTKDQFNRIFNHIESEDRNRHAISRNVDLLQNNLLKVEKAIDKHDEILRNGGRGLMFRVGNIERDQQNNDKAWQKWAAIGGFLMGAGALVIEIFKR